MSTKTIEYGTGIQTLNSSKREPDCLWALIAYYPKLTTGQDSQLDLCRDYCRGKLGQGGFTPCESYVPCPNPEATLTRLMEADELDMQRIRISKGMNIKNISLANIDEDEKSRKPLRDSDSNIFDAIDDEEMKPEEITEYSIRRSLDTSAAKKGRKSRSRWK